MSNKNPKALVLFSGGLDSRLTIKILQQQNIEIDTIFFKLPFGGGCCNNFECVFNYSQVQGVKLNVIDCTKEPYLSRYLNIIKHPNHGRGSGINPCKDCKIFMFILAKELMKKINADFLATGEVLGQRPFSQLKKDLLLTEEKSGCKGIILRPLSAKLLPITIPEQKKLIDREKLLKIEGRQRRIQKELAKEYKIKYPESGGGCLLCEKDYMPKLKDLFNKNQNIKYEDILLLRIGRHFRKNGKIVIGKNQKQNSELELLNKALKYHIIIPDEIPGPTAIFENIKDKELTNQLISAYSSNNFDLRNKFEKYRI